MTQHTTEPWGVFQDASGDVFVSAKETSFHIAEVGSEDDDSVIPDARRIAACVNACSGWETSQLEAMEMGSLKESLVRVMQQRDDLLAALEKAEACLAGVELTDYPVADELAAVREAIAMAKGSATATKITGETK